MFQISSLLPALHDNVWFYGWGWGPVSKGLLRRGLHAQADPQTLEHAPRRPAHCLAGICSYSFWLKNGGSVPVRAVGGPHGLLALPTA